MSAPTCRCISTPFGDVRRLAWVTLDDAPTSTQTVLCPPHAAAAEMYEALDEAELFLMHKARRDPEERELVGRIAAALRHARGEP